ILVSAIRQEKEIKGIQIERPPNVCQSVVLWGFACCCDAGSYATGISNTSRVTHGGQVSAELPD
ncbi:hypothetical protein NG726_29765, partial [Pseudomonas sp. MOB-449]|nr:hypothetical protein [Pseudomonas sp. MOB-449]